MTAPTWTPGSNWPRERKKVSRHKRKCQLSRDEVWAKITELNSERLVLLNLAYERPLTSSEVRLAKHIMREIDWYEMHDAEPIFKQHDETMRTLRKLKRAVAKAEKLLGKGTSS